ncbi:MAG: hypothetical protein GY809_09755, partial [Planctomycetes bacterium]|nr:hypothetical protein [Planctomycetota bacterium]
MNKIASILVAALMTLGAARAHESTAMVPSAEDRTRSPGHTTYYIDPAQGNDTASGLRQHQAWRTFTHINRLLLCPGDQVHITSPGSFDQTLMLTGAGTAEAPIEIHFAPGRYDF